MVDEPPTPYNFMKYDPKLLKKVMDAVRNDPALLPKDGKTYCNFNAFRVAQELGQPLFWNEDANRIMLANEMVADMNDRPQIFSKFYQHDKAWELANEGYLIFAALASEGHGHIAPVYPSKEMVVSGKWGLVTVNLSNVGIRNDVMGANFCFASMPSYYLVL